MCLILCFIICRSSLDGHDDDGNDGQGPTSISFTILCLKLHLACGRHLASWGEVFQSAAKMFRTLMRSGRRSLEMLGKSTQGVCGGCYCRYCVI